MMDDKVVEHSGIVTRVEEDKVQVSLLNVSACASCHAKGICAVSEAEQKIIDINNFANISGQYKIGETVNVSFQQSAGFKALLIGYILPFLLLFITLVTTWTISSNEALAGLLSLAVLLPYFFLLKLFNSRLNKTFSFTISKI
jgi:sigma-E factor negative regulatory protein RseC